jgi:peptide deformylase
MHQKNPESRRQSEGTHDERRASGSFPIAVRKVLTRPNAYLGMRALDVDPCDPAVVALGDVLVATMRASPACVGLAAPQIGESMRVFCMDVRGHRRARSCAGLVVVCNPKIVWRGDDVVLREGCMSVPHLTGNVVRAAEVTVVGYEPGSGHPVRLNANAIEARCLQHEIDHLDGMVFVDRVRNVATDIFARQTYA